jgi:hypothetical protein
MKDPQFRHLANWMNTKFVSLVADRHCEGGKFSDAAIAAHDRALEAPGGLGRAAELGRG